MCKVMLVDWNTTKMKRMSDVFHGLTKSRWSSYIYWGTCDHSLRPRRFSSDFMNVTFILQYCKIRFYNIHFHNICRPLWITFIIIIYLFIIYLFITSRANLSPPTHASTTITVAAPKTLYSKGGPNSSLNGNGGIILSILAAL